MARRKRRTIRKRRHSMGAMTGRETMKASKRFTPTPLAGLNAVFKAAGYPTICRAPKGWKKFVAELAEEEGLKKRRKRRSRSI